MDTKAYNARKTEAPLSRSGVKKGWIAIPAPTNTKRQQTIYENRILEKIETHSRQGGKRKENKNRLRRLKL